VTLKWPGIVRQALVVIDEFTRIPKSREALGSNLAELLRYPDRCASFKHLDTGCHHNEAFK
jgi:hypothetical protein